jgi:ParB family chromosome partitioning protein
MKYEALKHQGKRVDLTSDQLGPKYKSKRSDQNLAEQMKTSQTQIKRYMRLTFLNTELLDMVDDKQISFNPAVELSYLKQEEQKILYKIIQREEATPSLSQSQKLKQLSQMGGFNEAVAFSIITEVKPNQKEKFIINEDKIKNYFPRNFTPKQKEELIIKLLEKWARQQKRNQER